MTEKSLHDQIFDAVCELFAVAPTKPGQILVVGCSTSEILGQKIGTSGDIHPANEVFETLRAETNKRGIYLACQCCEHLNRALVVERAALKNTVLLRSWPCRTSMPAAALRRLLIMALTTRVLLKK